MRNSAAILSLLALLAFTGCLSEDGERVGQSHDAAFGAYDGEVPEDLGVTDQGALDTGAAPEDLGVSTDLEADLATSPRIWARPASRTASARRASVRRGAASRRSV